MRSVARGGLAVSSVFATLLLFEGVLRLTGAGEGVGEPAFLEWIRYDPVLGWKNRPGEWTVAWDDGDARMSTRVEVNALGFRGPDVSVGKPEGIARIVCLGDSVTFGVIRRGSWFVPSLGWPEALAERLEREGFDHVEVINAAVVGYSSAQGLRQLVTRVVDLEPDVLIVRFGANDFVPSVAPERRVLEPRSPLLRELFYASLDWRLTRVGLRAWQQLPIHPKPQTVPWVTEAQYRRNLDRIVEVGRGGGAQVLLLDYPLAPPARAATSRGGFGAALRRSIDRLQVVLLEVADETGAPLLLTAPRLFESPEPAFDTTDIVHPNERGARVLGDAVFEELRTRGWLGTDIGSLANPVEETP